MPRTRTRLVLAVASLGLVVSHAVRPGAAAAQDPPPVPPIPAAPVPDRPQEDPKREAAALHVGAARKADRGAWEDASRDLRKALAADPSNEDSALLLSFCLEHSGRLQEAVELLDAHPSSDASVRVVVRRGELCLLVSDVRKAEALARAALGLADASLPARLLLGRCLEATGRRADAAEAYDTVNSTWARSQTEQDFDEDLLAVARARMGLLRVSSEYNMDGSSVTKRYEPVAGRREPPPPIEAWVETGEVFLRGMRDVSAKEWFERADKRNPHFAPAIFGLARQAAFRFDDDGAAELAERALRENPAHVPSLLFLAQMALGDSDFEAAEKRIEAAAAVSPESPEVRGTRAALHALRGSTGAFEGEVKAILARNRYASAAYLPLAAALEEQRRFAEALEYAKKAFETDPRDFEAQFLMARNLLNVGRDDDAEKVLLAGEKDDPFPNRYRANFVELFRATKDHARKETAAIHLRFPAAEEFAYVPLLLPQIEASSAMLTKKWGFEIEDPTFISVFDMQDDFATRTIGLPGFPALGACFGRVVTLDSPRALPPGAFGWRAVMHHEFAHVVTLQLSKGRVPRWLTEGASVYEERKLGKVWERDSEREVVDAIAGDEVLTLANINQAFRGYRVMYAYYQGGLMCEFVEKEFGFPKLRELVVGHADGSDTPAVVRRVLGIEPAEFDRRVLAHLKDFVKDAKVLPRPSAKAVARLRAQSRKTKDDPEMWWVLALGQAGRRDAAGALDSTAKFAALRPQDPRITALRALVARIQSRPDQAVKFAEEAIAGGFDVFDLRLLLAEHAKGRKDFESAKTHLRRAIELFPQCADPDGPRLQLSGMLLGEGESKLDEAMDLLRAHVAYAENDFPTRVKLIEFARTRMLKDEELQLAEHVREIVPLPNGGWSREECAAIHERIAELRLERKDFAAAELAARCAAEVAIMGLKSAEAKPLDAPRRAELLALHAESLRLLGRSDESAARAREAIRLDPENAAAAETLRNLAR